MAMQLGGLASGVDTNSIIEQLMALERRPLFKKEREQKLAEARQATLRDIATRLKNLRTAGADLRSAALWAPKQTVESTDAAKTSAKSVGSSAAGSYVVDVTQLARAEQRAFSYAPGTADSTLTVNGRDYLVPAGASHESVVNSINNDSSSSVFAAAVNGQVVLSSKATGAASTITATSTAPAAQWSEDLAKQRLGLDAAFKVDGTSRTSASNTIADAIVGVELTFKAAGSVTVNVGGAALDHDAVVDKVKAFVEQYNSTVDFVRSKLTEKKVQDPKSEAERQKGMLRSDTMLSSVVSRLRTTMSEALAGNPATLDQLMEIGISTGAATGTATVSADAVSGKLTFDEAKLRDALKNDSASVKRLLGGDSAAQGLGQRLEALIKPITDIGGSIDERVKSLDGQVGRIRKSMDEIDRRLLDKEKRLKAQFAAMERSLSASQSQQSFLASQLSALG